MKHCPYCGKELPEEMQFCPYCMKKLIAEQPVAGMPAKKRMLGWSVIVGGVAVLVAVCVLVIELLPNLSQDVPAGDMTTTTSELHAQVTVDDGAEAVNGTAGSGGSTTASTGDTTTTVTEKATTTNGKAQKSTITTVKGKTSTTKATTGTTKATGSTSAQGGAVDPCVGGHNWQAITETVEHDEVGHYEQVVAGYNTVTIYKCAVCYRRFASLDDYYEHFEEHIATSDQLVVVFRDRYETDTEREPIYKQKWVVDKKAYTEQVVVGHKCAVCGATQ